MDPGQGDLGTLANVVTSLANLSDSLRETLNNGDTSDSQHEEQSASEITRSVSSSQRGGEFVSGICNVSSLQQAPHEFSSFLGQII